MIAWWRHFSPWVGGTTSALFSVVDLDCDIDYIGSMAERISCIYAIISPSGKAYIGSTCDYAERSRQHKRKMKAGKHHSDAMNHAVAKYGFNAFSFEILERCEVPFLIEREQWWFGNHGFVRLYNASGIAGRPEHTPEVRAKLSAAAKGKVPSAETRAKISAASKLQVRTPEWNKKVADAQRGKIIPDEVKAKMSAAAKARERRPTTEETKRKIGKANKGRVRTPEWLAKASAAQLARYERDGPPLKSDETKAKMSAAAKARKPRPQSEETRRKISEALKGKKKPRK